MERLRQRLRETTAALKTLQEALALAKLSPLERDGTIQRFEFTFESFWKTAQIYLSLVESLTANSPKSCMRALGEAGVFSASEASRALAMADDRNLTVHTYIESIAKKIYRQLPRHAALLEKGLEAMQRRLS